VLGGEDQIEALVRGARAELVTMRTVRLGKLLPEKATADVYIVLTPGPRVEEMRFIQGSEALRRFPDDLRTASYPIAFPDSTAVKLVRRGTVTCPTEGGDCAIELLTADRARATYMYVRPEKPIVVDASAPAVLDKVNPEYSEVARKAKYSGTVVLQVTVDATGGAKDIRVRRSLGLGLDEKAAEAVKKWKFRPGYRSGQPVAVQASIEVNFRLLETIRGWCLTHADFVVPLGATKPVLTNIDLPKYHQSQNAPNGQLVLIFEIDQDGKPQNVRVEKPVDVPTIKELIQAAEKWRFMPGQKDGERVPASARFEFGWIGPDKE
jgi:TonB family protein